MVAPRPVELSVRLWFAVATLVVLTQVVTLLLGLGVGLPALVLPAVIVVGALLMRAGRGWARILTGIAGGVLCALVLFVIVGFVSQLVQRAELLAAPGTPVLITLMLMLVVALGLSVAAIVLMFRPEANSYFTADKTAS